MSAIVLDAMREASERLGVTVLIVTHDPTIADHVRRTVQIRDGRTSTEVLRHTEVDEHGVEHLVAEEYTVIDRAGRMQLPSGYVTELGLRDRVRLELEPDHVGVWPDAERNKPVEVEHHDTLASPTQHAAPRTGPLPASESQPSGDVPGEPGDRHTAPDDDPNAAFRRPEEDS